MDSWIYTPDHNNTSRYTLGIEAENQLLCFGINPSTAEPGNLDNTVKSVVRIAERHHFDGWVMLNIYPQRATNPNDMHAEINEELHAKNLAHIEKLLARKRATILAAWGTLIEKRPYLKNCLSDIANLALQHNSRWVRIGPLSKHGHPHHPLYLSNEERLQPFDMSAYIQQHGRQT